MLVWDGLFIEFLASDLSLLLRVGLCRRGWSPSRWRPQELFRETAIREGVGSDTARVSEGFLRRRWTDDRANENVPWLGLLRGVRHLGAALNPAILMEGPYKAQVLWAIRFGPNPKNVPLNESGFCEVAVELDEAQTRLGWFVAFALVWRGLVAIEMATAGAVSRNSNPRTNWCSAVVLVKLQVWSGLATRRWGGAPLRNAGKGYGHSIQSRSRERLCP